MKMKKRFLSILLSLVMVLGLMPGMSLTAYAEIYDSNVDKLQADDILEPGAEFKADNKTIILQANGWCTRQGDEEPATYIQGTEGKTFNNLRMVKVSSEEGSLGAIEDEEDYTRTRYYPYANGAKADAWKVVSVEGGDEPWDSQTITLTGYAETQSNNPFASSVYYRQYDSTGTQMDNGTIAANAGIKIESDTKKWVDGKTYIADGTVTIDSRVKVTGTVNLILLDGASLTINGGIAVKPGNTLSIYAGNTTSSISGSGKLTAAASRWNAGIGSGASDWGETATVNIHGGSITATGGENGAGIGGEYVGIVNIYDGSVTANGGGDGAGIGGGYNEPGGTVTIYGGTVTATGGERGAGIGGGMFESGGTVSIYGGTVTASGGNKQSWDTNFSDSMGIGKGCCDNSSKTAGTLTLGTGVSMIVSADNSTWSAYDGSTRAQYMKTGSASTKAAPAVSDFTYTAPNYGFPTYDGNAKTATVVPKEDVTGMGQVTVKYYRGTDWEEAKENEVQSPIDAGEYYVGITVAEGDNYSAVSDVLHDSSWKFTINKATPTATNFTYNAPSDLTYNDTAKIATVMTKDGITGMGNVTVKYYSDQYCTKEVTPTNVGTYYVGITLSEGNNYRDASSALHDDWSFTITKAAGSISYATASVSKTYGDAAFTNELTKTGDGTVSYASDKTDVATVNSETGEVTIVGAGETTITATVADSANYSYAAKTASYTLTVSAKTMTVSAEGHTGKYDGNPHSITVNVTEPTSGTTIAYGTTEGTYDLTANPEITDVSDSKTIYFKVTAPNYADYTGSATVTISKADQTAPVPPTEVSKSTNSITLAAITNGEYKMGDGDTWQESPTFTGLTKSTEYTFYQRLKADANHNASPASTPVAINTADHTHQWSYAVGTGDDADTITATCADTDGGHGTPKTATLTINAPALTTYGGAESAEATIEGSIDGVENPSIVYKKGNDPLNAAPTNAGTYTASITLGGATASVEYTIAPATTTITENPAASEITYGKTLADSTLTGGAGSVAGTFAWKDSTIVPAVSDSQKTEYDVVFTPTDGNYATAECKVKLTVIKADASRDVPEKALPYTGQPQPLVNAGTVNGGTLQYALGTDDVTAPADGWSTDVPTATEPGTYYVWYKVVGDENHNGVDPACIVVTIAEPTSQETPVAAPATPESVSDYTLLASMKTSGDKAFKLKWTAVSGAEGYDVFFGRVGKKAELKTSVNGTSCKIKKLKRGIAYKAFVKAWKTENGQKVYIGEASPDVYAITGGRNNKYTTPKKITVKKKNLTVAVGGSKKIKASLKKFSNSRRYLNHTAKIRYYSSNRAVATVNAKGKVTGVAPGTCTVYAVAENGLRKGVKITVK